MSTESLAVVATGFSVFALLVVLALAVQVGRLHRAYDALVGGHEGATFPAAIGRHTAAVTGLRADVELLRDDVSTSRTSLADALRHVAVVRYDAFADQGGALSFSAALLDATGNGLVLTSLNARSETRTYAKGVQGGQSDAALSPEELEAIARATGKVRA